MYRRLDLNDKYREILSTYDDDLICAADHLAFEWSVGESVHVRITGGCERTGLFGICKA